MIRFFVLALFFLLLPPEGNARSVKLGDTSRPATSSMGGGRSSSLASSSTVSCLENSDCPYDKECITLQCESVCKNDTCSAGTHCVASQSEPHSPKCVECTMDYHCPNGFFCDGEYSCKKKDPCLNAVCSPAAPFCLPEPYKTLPYTCVQCLENAHCPPVAGLTRSCSNGYCLFNVEGNIPAQKQERPVSTGAVSQPSIRKVHQVEVAPPPSRPPVVPSADVEEEEESEEDYYEDEGVFDED